MVKKKNMLKSQSGVALVIALVMMVVLTLIGLASMFGSTFEIKISARKKCSTDAFYSSDGGIQVVTANVDNFNTSVNTYPYDPFDSNPGQNITNTHQVTITYDTSQKGAPRGQGISATQFEYEHFQVESTGESCADPVPSTTIIQEKMVRLIPTMQGGY